MEDKDGWIIERFTSGRYEVNANGDITSFCYKKPRLLKTKIRKKKNGKPGYVQVVFKDLDGKSVCCLVHRIVALIHLPNPLNLPQVNHKDGDKQNNKSSNLEWVTAQENVDHAVENGFKTDPVGEDVASAKVKEADVLEIRRLRLGGLTYEKIGSLFGLSRITVSEICRRKLWRHI